MMNIYVHTHAQVEWSSASTCVSQMAAIRRCRCEVLLGATTFRDIDTVEDLIFWHASVSATGPAVERSASSGVECGKQDSPPRECQLPVSNHTAKYLSSHPQLIQEVC